MEPTTDEESGGTATDERRAFGLEVERRDVLKAATVAAVGLSGLGALSRGASATDGVPVAVDIRPGSCPNPLNVESRGVLPVAILGTAEFDVTQVDPVSVTLAGVPPLRWALYDVATPYQPLVGKDDAYDCTTGGPDGYTDLTFKFRTQEVVAALGDVDDGDVVVLYLTGTLVDGTPFHGEDVVVIRAGGT